MIRGGGGGGAAEGAMPLLEAVLHDDVDGLPLHTVTYRYMPLHAVTCRCWRRCCTTTWTVGALGSRRVTAM